MTSKFSIMFMMLSLVVVPVQAQQTATAETADRLGTLLRTSTLEFLNDRPFEIHLDFQLYDLVGNPTEKGTLVQRWGDLADTGVTVQAPSFRGSMSDRTVSSDLREKFLLNQIRMAIVRPFGYGNHSKGYSLLSEQGPEDAAGLDCFVLSSASAPLSNHAGYCADANSNIAEMYGDLYRIYRSEFRHFDSHEVPMNLKLLYEGRVAMTAAVTELDHLQPDLSLAAKEPKMSGAPTIAGAFLAGQIIKKKEPKFPFEAKLKHISGSVLLSAVITKEGNIRDLTVIASPDSLLSRSATEAVSTWTYKPYLLNGVPTEVDSTITVNYNFNH